MFSGKVTDGNGATVSGIETTTDSIINNGVESPVIINSLIGNFNQVTTKGRQLYNFTDKTETQNGVTITFKDGIGTVIGTPTIESGLLYDVYFDEMDTSKLVNGVVYDTNICSFSITRTDGTTTNSSYFTYDSSTMTRIVPHISSNYYGTDYTNGITLKPIIYGGNYASWEIYTGGIPSPSPLYPQTLECPIFTNVNIATENESCSATSPTQIMLCSMNGVFDVIKDKKLTQRFNLITLVGTEEIMLDSNSNYFLYSPTVGAKPGSINIASDKYKYFATDTYTTNYGIFILENGIIGIKHDDFTTVDEYKTWLADNNVSIIYERATEEVIDLDEGFIEELSNLKLFVGENTIATNSTTIHPIIEIDYGTSNMAVQVLKSLINPNRGTGGFDVTVPTKVSELENDAGYITADDLPDVDLSNVVPSTRKIADIDLTDDITTDELRNSLGIVDDNAVANGKMKPWLYDASKEIIIGVYNGKPLYRYTIEAPSLANANDILFEVPADIEEVIHLTGILRLPNGNYVNIENSRHDATSYAEARTTGCFLMYMPSTNRVQISTYSDRTKSSALVVLEYTKTTDAEGSGNNLMPYGIYNAKLDDIESRLAAIENLDIAEGGGY